MNPLQQRSVESHNPPEDHPQNPEEVQKESKRCQHFKDSHRPSRGEASGFQPAEVIDVRSTERGESPNENSAILFLAPLMLFVPAIVATKAEYLHALPTLQPLQKNLPAVSEPHSVAVFVRFSAQLHKRHLLSRLHIKLSLHVRWDITQQQTGTRRHADAEGRSLREPQSP